VGIVFIIFFMISMINYEKRYWLASLRVYDIGVEKVVKELVEIGFNEVYPIVVGDGGPLFPSELDLNLSDIRGKI